MNDFLSKKLTISKIQRNIKPSAAMANYKPFVFFKDLIFISGQLPLISNEIKFSGKIDLDLNINEAKESITIATANLLWNLNDFVENQKNKIKCLKCVNIKGYINCTENFHDHSALFNEASNLIIKVFGKESGEHSRSVIGVNSLPKNSPVEIDGIFSVIFE